MEGSIINRTIKNYNDVLSSQKEETNYITNSNLLYGAET